MSADTASPGERRLRERLKRRRARREPPRRGADEPAAAPGGTAEAGRAEGAGARGALSLSDDFGHGGWTVTLDSLEVPADAWLSGAVGNATARERTPSGPAASLRERLRARRAAAARDDRAMAATGAAVPAAGTADAALPPAAAVGAPVADAPAASAPMAGEARPLPAADDAMAPETGTLHRKARESGAADPPAPPTLARDPAASVPSAAETVGASRAEPAPAVPGDPTGRAAPTPSARAGEPAQRRADEEDRPIIAAPQPRRRGGLTPSPRVGGSARRASLPLATSGAARAPARADGAPHARAQRIEGGGTVVIDDTLYPLLDWSLGGIAIAGEAASFAPGERRTLELEVDLGDYAVNLDLHGEVVDCDAERTAWRFVNPTETQRQVLRALNHAAIHGRSFAAPAPWGSGGRRGSLIDFAAGRRGARGGPLAAAISVPFNLAVVALAAGAVIMAIGDGRIGAPGPAGAPRLAGTSRAEPVRADHAAVAVERLTMASDRSGEILEWGFRPGEQVDNGEAVVSLVLNEASANRAVLLSPCDCFLARILADRGERVAAGETVALLYPRGSEGHVQAMFPSDTAPTLGQRVRVSLPYSGDSYTGVVESVGRLEDPQSYIGLPESLVASGRDSVVARIRTTPSVPAALAGDPAIVTLGPEA